LLGLAIRIPVGGGRHGDPLLASTRLGPLTRYALLAARDPYRATYSTLLPYQTPQGPAVIGAVPAPHAHARGFELRVAIGRRPWTAFAQLELGSPQGASDAEVSFDPMTNTLPGLEPYDWVARLREGAYRAARRSRGDHRRRP
jgi:hypothetical protein